MALFVGRYVNKIDKKGRVSVPKPFRLAFVEQSFSGLFAYPLFKFNAFEACGEEFMERLSDSLEDLPMFSDEQDDLSVILESAHRLPFDPEGRITLPREILKATGITNQTLFVGRGRRFQIWQPQAYEANRGQAFDRARAKGSTLQLRKPPKREGEES
ncbi:MAG TPA: division/cell wall cluster transcriptional repressor MraZ [Rhodospirillales bacterium]|jgi:MraZ protein|nr:MAG: Transcriptional regulator MraZ [Alphaproteobacteria bacterium MarineAlpha3_Bin2]HIC28455.1 division/cell wall cluster transcriptional repressor MraZ [Rhodospirillales bacterium]HIM24005.1 division/cell wall cluster transcriptional repressor MraZ [Rhodospirillales bacterium]HIM77343.1 division/cell wall cluster transcriptional repressor MraZ [Rhodospirillales bacterium]